jgi:glycosyltransferase involved in cell wall biosynthesis
MKIIHVTNYFRDKHNHIGGAEQACYRTIRMLRDNGYNTLAVTTHFDCSDNKNNHQIGLYELPTYEDYLPSIFAKFVEVLKWYALQQDIVALKEFKKILNKEKPDIIHFHNFQFLTFSLIYAAYKKKIPTCISIYDYWLFCPKAQLLKPDNTFCQDAHGLHCIHCLPDQFSFIQKMLLLFRKKIFDKAMDLIDRFIVLSEHSAKVLSGYGIPSEKIRIVPLTLPIEYQYAKKNMNLQLAQKSILFVGWLNDRKGVHVAIEALAWILQDEPDAKLYIIGGRAKFASDYEKRFEVFIDENALHNNIIFLGHQTPDTVRQYLQNTDILILPEQYENMSPLIMIEAMMLGKPIVASNLGGIPEYIQDGKTGFLVDAYRPKKFAEKILLLMKDHILQKNIGNNAKQAIMTRNSNNRVWDATIASYNELYRNSSIRKGSK